MACKATHAGSIPARASIKDRDMKNFLKAATVVLTSLILVSCGPDAPTPAPTNAAIAVDCQYIEIGGEQITVLVYSNADTGVVIEERIIEGLCP